MSARRAAPLVQALLDWYEVEARDLPWRRTRDPYAIWVSEIMLQQTRVETVLAYFERFLQRFPTVVALAEASIDEVLLAWAGLGYYRRAHHLHQAARIVRDQHGGNVPSTAAGLRELPGIGAYTAGAIASIAFDRDESVLDGNIIRVVSRWFCIEGDIAKSSTRQTLLERLDAIRPAGRASDFNQAMMDLGARLCLPRSPACSTCPVVGQCKAHRTGRESAFPQKRRRTPIPHIDVVAGAIWDTAPHAPDGRLLISQRKLEDMLGGLWELPGGKVEDGETYEQALHRELREELDIGVKIVSPLITVNHAYTHFRVTLHVFHCRHTSGEPRSVDVADWTWARPDELHNFAFPSADRKILAALARGGTPRS